MNRSILFLSAAVFGLALMFSGQASARPSIANAWSAAYPTSLSDDNVLNGTGTVCQLCHVNVGGSQPWNAYGWDLRTEIQNGATAAQAFALVEAANADGDPGGASNLTEINSGTQPGWTEGAVNTSFFASGATTPGQSAPASIQGNLDPAAVPGLGVLGQVVLIFTAMGGSTVLLRRRT